MRSKTLFKLFLVDFVIFLTGMGLLPLLPIYAKSFGIEATGVGLYMAVTYGAIAAGTVLSDRFANRLGYKRLFLVAGSLGLLALLLMGQATSFWQIVMLSSAVWFSGGTGIALVTVYTGLMADKKKLGRSFSLTFLAMPLASLVAGLTIGKVAEWRGYPFMFAILALAWAIWPLIAVIGGLKWPEPKGSAEIHYTGHKLKDFGRPFAFLLIATLLSSTTIYLLRLGTSYGMGALNFSPSAISGTSAAGGLVAIPLVYTIGSLSDRLGRKQFLISGAIMGGAGAVVLTGAEQLWHFWLATALVFMSTSVFGSVAPAFVVELLPREDRGRGLPYLSSMRNIGGIIGFASGGLLINLTGIFTLFLAAFILAAGAIVLLTQIPLNTRQPATGGEMTAGTPQGVSSLLPTR